jgi:DNA-binding NarL/FixJ family response regulator
VAKPELSTAQKEGLLRALYQLDSSDRTYLSEVRNLWARTPFGGSDTIGFGWSGDHRGTATIETLVAPSPAIEAAFQQVYAATSRSVRLSMLQLAPHYGVMTSMYPGTQGHRRSIELGFPDFSALFGSTQAGSVVVVGTPLPPGARPPVATPTLNRLAAHLASVRRLRKRLAAKDAFHENDEAIFAPGGALQEARGQAKGKTLSSRLRALVLAREKALARPELALWPALLDGRYTIADRFESSGKRYVVAFRNDTTAAPLNGLTSLERVVVQGVSAGVMEKVLAIDLGLSVPRVSNVLGGALRKLRLASAIELSLVASSSNSLTLDDNVLGKHIVAAFRLDDESGDVLSSLTATERAVTADLLRGLSNREIAARRNRSERTIANQVASVLEKMKVGSRRALAAKLGR